MSLSVLPVVRFVLVPLLEVLWVALNRTFSIKVAEISPITVATGSKISPVLQQEVTKRLGLGGKCAR